MLIIIVTLDRIELGDSDDLKLYGYFVHSQTNRITKTNVFVPIQIDNCKIEIWLIISKNFENVKSINHFFF